MNTMGSDTGADLAVSRNLENEALLASFLESTQCPVNTMNFYQLDGYLRALACAPVNLPLAQWQPLIFNDTTPTYNDQAHAEQIQCSVINLYNFHCAQVINDRCDLPCSNAYLGSQEDRIDIEQWARGFLQGYIVCESNWNELLDGMQSDQVGHKIDTKTILDDFDDILSIVSAVADAKYAVQEGTNPEELGAIFARLPKSVIRFGQIGRTASENKLANHNSDGAETAFLAHISTPLSNGRPSTKKVSRNELCPCRSGKKFKKCCLH